MAVRALFLCIALLVGFAGAAPAQQRSMNDGAPGLLRIWPQIGVWQAALMRLNDGSLGCWVITSHSSNDPDDRYFWGVRSKLDQTAIEIIDKNPVAVSGPTIDVVIDGLTVGDFSITKRIDQSGMHTVAAELATGKGATLLRLLRSGGAVKFVTAKATYSASLAGAAQSLRNVDACLEEIHDLESSQEPTGKSEPQALNRSGYSGKSE
jgi:hypothetical protein